MLLLFLYDLLSSSDSVGGNGSSSSTHMEGVGIAQGLERRTRD